MSTGRGCLLIQSYRSIEVDLSGLFKRQNVRVVSNVRDLEKSPFEFVDELAADIVASQKASFVADMEYLAYLIDMAKQKINESLLLILAFTVIKNHLDELIQFISFLFNAPEEQIINPTRFSRISPFIHFP